MANLLYTYFFRRQKKYPELIVSIEAAPNRLIFEKILSNDIDLGIVTQKSQSSDFDYSSIGRESLCLILPKKYSRRKITLKELNAIGFINHPDGFHHAERLLSANFKYEFSGVHKLKVKGYINQIGQILLPVAEGVGYTVLPESTVRRFKPQLSLFVAPVKNLVQDELFLVRKKHKVIPSRYQWFEDEIRRLIINE